MRALLQRVKEAKVEVAGVVTGRIGRGLVVLLGIEKTDCEKDADYLVDRVVGLRIFQDAGGKMNLSVRDAGGALLVVSQFTLFADCRRGRRPSFDQAAGLEQANRLYNYFVEAARKTSVPVETGVFQAFMTVTIVNEGPVTIICDSHD